MQEYSSENVSNYVQGMIWKEIKLRHLLTSGNVQRSQDSELKLFSVKFSIWISLSLK